MVLGGVLAVLLGVSPLADACEGQAALHDATPKQVQAFVRSRNLDVLTFAGYSGAGYQDRDAMLAQAKAVL